MEPEPLIKFEYADGSGSVEIVAVAVVAIRASELNSREVFIALSNGDSIAVRGDLGEVARKLGRSDLK